MELTGSWERVLPQDVVRRFDFYETRQAGAILRAVDGEQFDEVVDVLRRFEIRRADLVRPGGQESRLAQRFNAAFRDRGWREARVDTEITLRLHVRPYRPAGEEHATETTTSVENPGYLVDNFKGRVALDLEWNAKDGNLDRDIAAYRSLYDAGFIDVAVLVTRTQDELRSFARRVRLAEGMDEADFLRTFGVGIDEVYGAVIEKYSAQGLLRRAEHHVALTDAGMKLGNEVFAAFLLDT